MKSNHFPTAFTNRFREEYLVNFFSREQQYGEFYFRQYAGGKQEISLIGNYYAQHMSDARIINRLLNKIEKESCGEYRRLSAFAEKLEKTLLQGMEEEPCVSCYYNRLLAIVTPFRQLITTFQEKIQCTLLDKLQLMNGKQDCREAHIESEEIDAVIIVMEQYADELQQYYDAFDAFLYQESRGHRGVVVSTWLEQCLVSLITLLEKSLIMGEELQVFLELWKMRVAVREMQEICN